MLTTKLSAIADGFRLSRETDQMYTLDEMAVLAAEKAESFPDGTNITFGEVKQTIMTPIPGDKGYYNGVLLPKIPDDVQAQYPYMWFRPGAALQLVCATSPWYYNSGKLYTTTASDKATFGIKDDAWVQNWSGSDNAGGWSPNSDGSSKIPTWSSHDIPNGSPTATDIYFNGSEPITEEETTGLFPVEREGTYTIASEDLNELGALAQRVACKSELMTIGDMIYHFSRAKYIPQGNAECSYRMEFNSSAAGTILEG